MQQFVRVIPHDYKRMLESIEREKASGLNEQEAVLAAFTANVAG